MNGQAHGLARRWPLGLAALVVLSGCTIGRTQASLLDEIHPPVPADEMDRLVPADALREDLALLVRTLGEVHPGAYRRMPRAAFVASIDSLGATLDGPRTRREFFLAVQPTVARLRDGHTRLLHPSGETERLRARGSLFPVPVSIVDGALVARRNVGGVAEGDTLMSIDGTPGAEWVERVVRLESGESVAMQASHAERSFAETHGLFDRDGGPYEILVNGQEHRVDGVAWDTLSQWRRSLQSGPNWSYETRPDRIGVLTVRGFRGGREAVADALDRAVGQAQSDSAVGLIIDLRDNPGGDSRLMQELVARITDRPYRIASRMEHRRSEQYGAFWKQKFVESPAVRSMLRVIPLHRLHPVSRRYYRTPVGEDQVTDFDPAPPEAGVARFPGPVAVLTSRYSASASVIFAAIVQDHGLGTVVGEETGEWATMHGEAYLFELPNARLLAMASTVRIVRPSGSEAPGGVVPDVPVPAAAALDRAAALLLGGPGEGPAERRR